MVKTFYVIEKGRYYFYGFDNTSPVWGMDIDKCIQFDTRSQAVMYKAEYNIDGEVIEHVYEE